MAADITALGLDEDNSGKLKAALDELKALAQDGFTKEEMQKLPAIQGRVNASLDTIGDEDTRTNAKNLFNAYFVQLNPDTTDQVKKAAVDVQRDTNPLIGMLVGFLEEMGLIDKNTADQWLGRSSSQASQQTAQGADPFATPVQSAPDPAGAGAGSQTTQQPQAGQQAAQGAQGTTKKANGTTPAVIASTSDLDSARKALTTMASIETGFIAVHTQNAKRDTLIEIKDHFSNASHIFTMAEYHKISVGDRLMNVPLINYSGIDVEINKDAGTLAVTRDQIDAFKNAAKNAGGAEAERDLRQMLADGKASPVPQDINAAITEQRAVVDTAVRGVEIRSVEIEKLAKEIGELKAAQALGKHAVENSKDTYNTTVGAAFYSGLGLWGNNEVPGRQEGRALERAAEKLIAEKQAVLQSKLDERTAFLPALEEQAKRLGELEKMQEMAPEIQTAITQAAALQKAQAAEANAERQKNAAEQAARAAAVAPQVAQQPAPAARNNGYGSTAPAVPSGEYGTSAGVARNGQAGLTDPQMLEVNRLNSELNETKSLLAEKERRLEAIGDQRFSLMQAVRNGEEGAVRSLNLFNTRNKEEEKKLRGDIADLRGNAESMEGRLAGIEDKRRSRPENIAEEALEGVDRRMLALQKLKTGLERELGRLETQATATEWADLQLFLSQQIALKQGQLDKVEAKITATENERNAGEKTLASLQHGDQIQRNIHDKEDAIKTIDAQLAAIDDAKTKLGSIDGIVSRASAELEKIKQDGVKGTDEYYKGAGGAAVAVDEKALRTIADELAGFVIQARTAGASGLADKFEGVHGTIRGALADGTVTVDEMAAIKSKLEKNKVTEAQVKEAVGKDADGLTSQKAKLSEQIDVLKDELRKLPKAQKADQDSVHPTDTRSAAAKNQPGKGLTP